MTQPKAVVVGTGHSGTGFMAKVLKRAGANAGHEAWFNPHAIWVPDLDVDVAWEATVALPYDGIVWHQVREPLATITSLTYTADWSGVYWLYRREGMREDPGDPIERAMVSYVDMNLRAEKHASRRWRVEDVDAKLVRSLLKELGHKPDRHRVKKAVEDTSPKENKHWGSNYFSWKELPNVPIKDELIEMTERYGYEGP